MKIFGMGGIELVIILVVILLIFGPKNLPKLGNAFGKTVKNLRAGMNEGKAKDEPAAEEAADASEPVAEIEEDAAPAETQVAEADDTDLAEAAEQAVEQAEAAVDEAFAEAPKKVKRVVRKKVTLETTDEVVE